jgi:WD40 repeat protein
LAAAELRAALDEEIERLPVKYRIPLVLCYLAEKTHEQAALELGWPKSSVTARLARARELLQRRLRHRGFTVPAGLLATLLTEQSANAALPSLLTLSTVRLAVQALTGETLAATSVVILADGFVKGAAAAKYTAVLTLLATMGFAAAFGTWMASSPVPSPQQDSPPLSQAANDREEEQTKTRKPRLDLFGDPLPPGARARLGTLRLRQGGAIQQFDFAPDGKMAAASNDGRVCFWDVATGKEVHCLENAFSGFGAGVAFSPDGKILATGGGNAVRRWDTTTWKELPLWPLKFGRLDKLFFSPDGRTLACLGGVWQDNETAINTLVFLDTSTGRQLHHLEGRKNYVVPSIAFAPDSKTWAYADRHDKSIAFFEVHSGKELRRFEGHSKAAWTAAFSPDGKMLASTDIDGRLHFWDTATGKLLPQRGNFQVSGNLTFFPDGKRLLGWRGVPIRYDIASGKEIPTPGPRWTGESPVILSPDGTRLVWANEQHVLHLWDAATFKPIQSAKGHERYVRVVAFSPDGKVVISAAGDPNCVRRWDAATGQPLPPFQNVGDDVYGLAYSPDGHTLAAGTGGHGGAIQLLEAATGKRLHSLVVPGDHLIVGSLTFSADGRILMSNQGHNTRLWEMATRKVLHTIQGDVFPYGPRILALSPDGQILADGGGFDAPQTIHLRQAADEKDLRELQTQNSVSSLIFSPDGKTLASGGFLQTIKLWDVSTGRLLWQAKGRHQREGGVYFLTFSPDGKTLVSDDGEGGVYLWETATGNERWHFGKHRYSVRSGAFSRDGKLLATGSDDTTILIWDLAAAAGMPRQSPLSAKALDALWDALSGDDATKAFQAIHRFATAPEQTLPFLREHLKPVLAPDRKRVRQLVDMLDSDDFQKRQKAAEELAKQADVAAATLRQIMAKEKPSLEVRQRLQQILEGIESKPESLRAVRAVEVLEWIATPEAVRLIDELANGAAEARLTREASAAKRRLAR